MNFVKINISSWPGLLAAKLAVVDGEGEFGERAGELFVSAIFERVFQHLLPLRRPGQPTLSRESTKGTKRTGAEFRKLASFRFGLGAPV